MDINRPSKSSVTSESVNSWAAPLNRASESVVIYDLDGIIRFWNEASESLYGWDRAHVVGKRVSDIGWQAADISLLGGSPERPTWRGTLIRLKKSGVNSEVALRVEIMDLGLENDYPVIVEYAKPAELNAIGGSAWRCSCTLVSTLLQQTANRAASTASDVDARYRGDILRSLTVSSVNETASIFFGGSTNSDELIGRTFHSVCPNAYRDLFNQLLDEILISGRKKAEGVYSGVHVSISRVDDDLGYLRLELSGQCTHPRRAALLRSEANWMLCLYGRQYRQCENRGFNDREAAAS